ncbi:c-type cytochrome [Rhizobium anhuiense]|uniref:c-type cytochrome n=1 Tax=Rhizobium anhuiense TaxID=1184720 RepID=UPI0020CE4399|nr:c-type cytochrome [Rhizobium anhuiense]UTS90335.1 c-type cytochrome [Rhizobium anhuiense bv. trifolii]
MQNSNSIRALVRVAVASFFISTSMPLSDLHAQDADETAFLNNCSACHSLEDGTHKFGPSLHGIVGRTAGTVAGFASSKSYVEAGQNGVIWDSTNLDVFLERPLLFLGQHAPAPITNKMPIRVPRADTRALIIEFLLRQ